MSIINSQPLIGASGNQGGYTIAKSLRFRKSASAYLNKTTVSPTLATKFTVSFWTKLGSLDARRAFLTSISADSVTYWGIEFGSTNGINVYDSNASGTTGVSTGQVFRDPSAWYHIVCAIDTTQATASNRCKLYVNGSQITSFSATDYPPQNSTPYIQVASRQSSIGSFLPSATTAYLDGYLAETYFIDGQPLTPSSFGETDSITGVWKPKAYIGTYGTNGFYLKFTDVATTSGSNAGLGKDFSGNSNYWNTNNISVTTGATYDSMTDVPTLTSATAANYCVLNPLSNIGNGTISAGNLNYVASSAAWMSAAGTIFPTSGKWYFETTLTQFNSSFMVGVVNTSFSSWATYMGASANGWALQGTASGTGKWNNNSSATLAAGEASTTNDVFMVAYDVDSAKLWFGKNGTWYSSGDPAAGTNAVYTNLTGSIAPAVSSSTTTDSLAVNCGQRPFAYTPPTGFKALNTYNLSDSTIVAGNKVMDATLYTGNGSTQTITNAGAFKPDLVWVKARSVGYDHVLYDSVRGTGTTKSLGSNITGAEGANSIYTNLTSFDSNGFSVGTTSSTNILNNNTSTFVGWQWQAGQGSTSSNTSGSITSTVSVNTSAGFSIVTYTGTFLASTVGHGLGVTPKFIIVKSRSDAFDWNCWFTGFAGNEYLVLNSTTQKITSSTLWNNTTPTSSVFSVGLDNGSNKLSSSFVAYCWAEIAGFSKFGSYTGNGSTDGTFVYTGFRPKFIMRKNITQAYGWYMDDTSRNPSNVIKDFITANSSAAEVLNDANYALDIVSNGFKVRSSHITQNYSGDTYIYMAFAENPQKLALAR